MLKLLGECTEKCLCVVRALVWIAMMSGLLLAASCVLYHQGDVKLSGSVMSTGPFPGQKSQILNPAQEKANPDWFLNLFINSNCSSKDLKATLQTISVNDHQCESDIVRNFIEVLCTFDYTLLIKIFDSLILWDSSVGFLQGILARPVLYGVLVYITYMAAIFDLCLFSHGPMSWVY